MSSSGFVFSEMPVKFSMSEKRRVRICFFPPISALWLFFTSWVTRSEGTYFLKFTRPCFMPLKESTILSISFMPELMFTSPSSISSSLMSFISVERIFIGFEMSEDISMDMIIATIITMREIIRTVLLFL